jgi:arginine:ornithine antiporter/lysine permease
MQLHLTEEDKWRKLVRETRLAALIAMVVGSMIGSGIFTLPSRFAGATGVYGALIAWVIAGGGMLMLAFVFQTLAARKPDVIRHLRLCSTASAILGLRGRGWLLDRHLRRRVSYWVLISRPGAFFPVFATAIRSAVIVASVLVWAFSS